MEREAEKEREAFITRMVAALVGPSASNRHHKKMGSCDPHCSNYGGGGGRGGGGRGGPALDTHTIKNYGLGETFAPHTLS